MITLKYDDIVFNLDASQNILFESKVKPEIKELITTQIKIILETVKDDYKVSDGYFETYLANNLKNAFKIIKVKDDILQEINKKDVELIY